MFHCWAFRGIPNDCHDDFLCLDVSFTPDLDVQVRVTMGLFETCGIQETHQNVSYTDLKSNSNSRKLNQL